MPKFLLTISLAMSAPLTALAIINGQTVPADSFAARSTVMVLQKQFRESGRGQCSGTLVGPNLVLTAAHCVIDLKTNQPLDPKGFTIYFGNYDGANWNDQLARKGSDIRFHEKNSIVLSEANPSVAIHDVALVRFEGAAPADREVRPVLGNPALLTAGLPLLLAGYGNARFMGDPEEPKGRTLRSFETAVEVASHEISGQIEYSRPKVINSMEDYMKFIGGMAGGDSGGPAYATVNGVKTVVGIASGYRYNDQPFYENAPIHAQWLENAARELKAEIKFLK